MFKSYYPWRCGARRPNSGCAYDLGAEEQTGRVPPIDIGGSTASATRPSTMVQGAIAGLYLARSWKGQGRGAAKAITMTATPSPVRSGPRRSSGKGIGQDRARVRHKAGSCRAQKTRAPFSRAAAWTAIIRVAPSRMERAAEVAKPRFNNFPRPHMSNRHRKLTTRIARRKEVAHEQPHEEGCPGGSSGFVLIPGTMPGVVTRRDRSVPRRRQEAGCRVRRGDPLVPGISRPARSGQVRSRPVGIRRALAIKGLSSGCGALHPPGLLVASSNEEL